MKTVTLETAKKLKAAFDKAGIEMPWTEKYWADNVTYRSGRLPDAEELGKWLPEYMKEPDECECVTGDDFVLCIMPDGDGWTAQYGPSYPADKAHETIAEALAHLMIECLRVDPGQIKKHLEGLGYKRGRE